MKPENKTKYHKYYRKMQKCFSSDWLQGEE